MEIDNYINVFNQIKSKVNNELVASVILAEIGKDRRCEKIKEAREQPLSQLASFKQIAFLKSLGVNVPDKLTKKEASVLIEQARMQQVKAM